MHTRKCASFHSGRGSKAVASRFVSICSALIQLFKNGTRDYQEAAQQRSRRLFICLSTRARARARVLARGVRVFTGRRSERGGRSLTNIGFTHWQQPPITFLHTRLGSSPARTAADAFLRPGKEPTHFLDTLLRILMPELIIFLALLSGSLHRLSFASERLQRRAQQIRKVSLKAAAANGRDN